MSQWTYGAIKGILIASGGYDYVMVDSYVHLFSHSIREHTTTESIADIKARDTISHIICGFMGSAIAVYMAAVQNPQQNEQVIN